MWTFQQTYQYVCFNAIRWTADDTTYRNRQHLFYACILLFRSVLIDISHFDRLRLSYEFHIFSPSRHWYKLKNDIENKSIYRSAQSEIAQLCNMLLIVSDTCDVHSLIAKELEYIPKIILLREFKNYINLWDRLPDHIKADSEIQQHRRYLKHYNLLFHRSHIDGPAPFIKNYSKCQQKRAMVF